MAVESPKNSLKPILDPNHCEELYQQVIQDRALVQFWFADEKKIFPGKIGAFSTHQGKKSIEIDLSNYPGVANQIESRIKTIQGEGDAAVAKLKIYVKIQLETQLLFFESKAFAVAMDHFIIEHPKVLFEIQRRLFSRMKLGTDAKIGFSFLDPKDGKTRIIRRVLDLSAGGCAIMTHALDQNMFLQGRVLQGGFIKINNKKIETDAEIRQVYPTIDQEGKDSVKLGLMFTSIKKEDQDLIQAFVLEGLQKPSKKA